MRRMVFLALSILFLSGCESRMESDFIAGCESQGVDEDVCSCAYDRITDVFEEEDLDRIQRTMTAPPAYEHVAVAAFLACRDE